MKENNSTTRCWGSLFSDQPITHVNGKDAWSRSIKSSLRWSLFCYIQCNGLGCLAGDHGFDSYWSLFPHSRNGFSVNIYSSEYTKLCFSHWQFFYVQNPNFGRIPWTWTFMLYLKPNQTLSWLNKPQFSWVNTSGMTKLTRFDTCT